MELMQRSGANGEHRRRSCPNDNKACSTLARSLNRSCCCKGETCPRSARPRHRQRRAAEHHSAPIAAERQRSEVSGLEVLEVKWTPPGAPVRTGDYASMGRPYSRTHRIRVHWARGGSKGRVVKRWDRQAARSKQTRISTAVSLSVLTEGGERTVCHSVFTSASQSTSSSSYADTDAGEDEGEGEGEAAEGVPWSEYRSERIAGYSFKTVLF